MKARRKTSTCDAWQFNTLDCGPRWARTELRADELYLVRRSGKQLIMLGDWLVRDLDGEPMWLTDVEFRRNYELTAGERG